MGRRVAGLDGDARLILGGRASGTVRAQGVTEPLAGSEQPRAHRRGLDAEQLCDLGGFSLLDVGKMDDKAQIFGKVCERMPHRVVAQVAQHDVLCGHRGQLAGIAAGLAVVKRVDATAPRAFLVVSSHARRWSSLSKDVPLVSRRTNVSCTASCASDTLRS